MFRSCVLSAFGIIAVNAAISLLDQNTQQNAALVEQAAAASQSMSQQAEHLSELVGTFKLSEQQMQGKQPDYRHDRTPLLLS